MSGPPTTPRPPTPAGFDPTRAAERAADPRGWRMEDDALAAVYEVIAGRRDIRKFRPDDVPGDVLLGQLRAAGLPATVPAVLVTAESDAVAAALARQGGFDGYWTKPLDVAATLRSLAHWLEGA